MAKNEGTRERQGKTKTNKTNGNTRASVNASSDTNVRTNVNTNVRVNAKESGQKANKPKLKIISLGGVNEIGKNITVYEYGSDILLIDCGLAFPDDEMLGIDIVIPDFSYLVKNRARIRGLIVTHGHEDHIGGIPYLLKELNVPIYGTKMTLGLLRKKLEEHHLDKTTKLHIIQAKDKFKLGVFEVEGIRVNHSIADSLAYAIKTPVGTIVHTGDFKVDFTPIMGDPIDLARFGELGRAGVLALLMDSTNVERPGYTMSEHSVGDAFDSIFKDCNKRIIVATFASNVDRVQQILDASAKYGRKVAVSGRSMLNMIDVATELKYISIPKGLIIDIDQIVKYPPEKLTLITTGSQGEPMSALSRMAYSDHRKVEIGSGDLVVISANPIPGNEKSVNRMVNELCHKGADVVNDSLLSVHVSGHACQEELKMIMNLTKPKFFIPVHGEYRHLHLHKKLAHSMGIEEKNILLPEIGKVIEMDQKSCRTNGSVPSGRVLVDGLSVGDVGNIVLRDRMHLAQDGLIVVVVTIDGESGLVIAGPDIVSRGFVYVRESEDMMERMRVTAKKILTDCEQQRIKEWSVLKNKVKSAIGDLIYEETKRKPMILPVVMEI